MAPGVLWVSSRILHPDKLSPEKFSEWYENEHIQEVITLPGVPSAVRYEAVQPQPGADTYSNEAPWLVVYEFPDIAYRESDDFQGIMSRNMPSKELIEKLYSHTQFDIRFYQEVQVVEGEGAEKAPGKFIVSAATEPPSEASSVADYDKWYREEHIPMLARAPNFIRSRRYELVGANKLTQFEFADAMQSAPKYLALHEFGGDGFPWDVIKESTSTEWAKRVLGGITKSEAGWYKVKRDYPESEWGHVGSVGGK